MLRRTLLLISVSAAILAAKDAAPLAFAVDSIGMTVSDLDRSVDFYTRVLSFEKVSGYETHGDAIERTTGVFGARVRTARLRLGSEFIELTEFMTPRGRAIPADSRSNDRWFQHIAIITQDMSRAYRHLRSHDVRHSSPAPQRLPDWNKNAGGIEAFYFQDPDGHSLEILAFPPDKGSPRWHQPSGGALFLGIDHTAIVISSTEASTKFYRDLLGLAVAGESENHGPEQNVSTTSSAPGSGFEPFARPRDRASSFSNTWPHRADGPTRRTPARTTCFIGTPGCEPAMRMPPPKLCGTPAPCGQAPLPLRKPPWATGNRF